MTTTKKVEIIENNGNEDHLKWLVVVNGKIVASHLQKDTCEIHKTKILTPIKAAMYKGKKLI